MLHILQILLQKLYQKKKNKKLIYNIIDMAQAT